MAAFQVLIHLIGNLYDTNITRLWGKISEYASDFGGLSHHVPGVYKFKTSLSNEMKHVVHAEKFKIKLLLRLILSWFSKLLQINVCYLKQWTS